MSTHITSYPEDKWPWEYIYPTYEPPEPEPEPIRNPIVEGNIIHSGTYNDGVSDRDIFLSSWDMSQKYPTDARVIGGWENIGISDIPVHSDYEAYIRPFGNAEGLATDQLDYHHFQGHAQRQVQDAPVYLTLGEYPVDNQPFVVVMEPWWDDTPGWEGWGWKATITFSDPTRPPNARAIGVYNASWGYLYTTGAFVLTETGRDEDDNPIMQWQTHSPPGKATVEKEDIYYALLLGSTQEGRFVLGKEPQTNYFWEGDQVIPGETWAASGATVTGMAGTVTLVSDVAPFSTGTLVRIEGVEMTVTSVWAGQGLVLDPYRASTTGASIEVWQ